MTPLELRQHLYALIRENNLEKEVWLSLSMVMVRDAVVQKGGAEITLTPDALHPEKIFAEMQAMVDGMASGIIQRMQARN
jgi:hypothetical protein